MFKVALLLALVLPTVVVARAAGDLTLEIARTDASANAA